MSDAINEKLIEVEENPAIDCDQSDLETETVPPADNEATEDEENDSSPRRKSLTILGIVALVMLFIGGYFYLERNKAAGDTTTAATVTGDAKEETVVSVKVTTAEKQSIAQEFTAIGTVAPAEQSTVSASISAQIKQMQLLKNQFVRQGETLAVLASQDVQAQRSEAQAALDEARLNLQTLQQVTIPQTHAQTEKDSSDAKAVADNARAIYERRKDLYAKGGLSLKELESSQLALTNAENALRLAQQNSKLNTTAVNPNARAIAESKIKQAQERINTINVQANLAEVRAPISGVVTDQFQFQGEYAAAGAKLFTIANIGEVIVKANFADSVVANIQTGDSVTVYPTGATDERMGGKITLISRSADAQNRAVEVWASFPNGRGLLRVGDAVQFVVSAKPSNNAVIVPVSAITFDASNSDEGTVMTVDAESIAHETKVKTGIKSGDRVEITEGLSGGETVVVEGNYALPDGTKVEIAKEDANSDEEK